MKPTSPEDRDLEKMGSEVSERYRAGAEEEPSARLDAAVLAAARGEVAQPPQRRNWQRPASIAAMLVIGVSVVLLLRDNEPPLPTLDRPAEEAKLAKSAPPQLAMKEQPKAIADSYREDRPSRERSTRLDRKSIVQDESAAMRENAASGASAQPAPAPAAPAIAGLAKQPANQEQSRITESSDLSSSKKAKALADARPGSHGSAQPLRQNGISAGPIQAQDWLTKVEDLLRDGKDADAQEQLLAFRKQFPDYPLSQRLQALLPPDLR